VLNRFAADRGGALKLFAHIYGRSVRASGVRPTLHCHALLDPCVQQLVSVPPRLGALPALLEDMLRRAKRLPFMRLLHHHCPLPPAMQLVRAELPPAPRLG
jgi:hypothetical protein